MADRARRAVRRAVPAEPDHVAQIAALEAQIAGLQQAIRDVREAPPRVYPVDDRPAANGAAAVLNEGVAPPVMLTLRKAVIKYSGTISYDAYRQSFVDLVRYYPAITDQQRFELLSSALSGDALTLLEDLGANRTFAALDTALSAAYTKPVHAWSEMRNLQTLKQSAEETLETWSTRVTRATRRAFPDTPEARIEEYCVQYFLSGLCESDVKSGVAGITCATMAGALDACRLARSRLGTAPSSKKARTAMVAETMVVRPPTDQSSSGPSTVSPDSKPSTSPVLAKLDELAAKLTAAVNQVSTRETSATASSSQSKDNDSASPSTKSNQKRQQAGRGGRNQRGGNGMTKDRRDRLCFKCHQPGHFIASCPYGQPPVQAMQAMPYGQPPVQAMQAMPYFQIAHNTAPQQMQVLYPQQAALTGNSQGVLLALPAPAPSTRGQSRRAPEN